MFKKIPKICDKFRKYLFRKMALADPIFTIDGERFQLFWAAFDLPMRVVPLNVALRLEIFFWAISKK